MILACMQGEKFLPHERNKDPGGKMHDFVVIRILIGGDEYFAIPIKVDA